MVWPPAPLHALPQCLIACWHAEEVLRNLTLDDVQQVQRFLDQGDAVPAAQSDLVIEQAPRCACMYVYSVFGLNLSPVR